MKGLGSLIWTLAALILQSGIACVATASSFHSIRVADSQILAKDALPVTVDKTNESVGIFLLSQKSNLNGDDFQSVSFDRFYEIASIKQIEDSPVHHTKIILNRLTCMSQAVHIKDEKMATLYGLQYRYTCFHDEFMYEPNKILFSVKSTKELTVKDIQTLVEIENYGTKTIAPILDSKTKEFTNLSTIVILKNKN